VPKGRRSSGEDGITRSARREVTGFHKSFTEDETNTMEGLGAGTAKASADTEAAQGVAVMPIPKDVETSYGAGGKPMTATRSRPGTSKVRSTS